MNLWAIFSLILGEIKEVYIFAGHELKKLM